MGIQHGHGVMTTARRWLFLLMLCCADLLLSLGGKGLLHRSQGTGSHRVHNRDRPHLCSAGLVGNTALSSSLIHLATDQCGAYG